MTIPTDGRIDLDALAELARKATPGPWRVASDLPAYAIMAMTPEGKGGHRVVQTPNQNNYRRFGPSNGWDGISQIANAAFIAALDPQTVLALIDLARRAEAKADDRPDPTPDAAFAAWVASLPKESWAKYDLSACRLGWDAARRAAIPSEQGEAAGEAGTMPGTDGFTMAVFRAADVPVGTKLYPHPAPAAGVKVTDAMVEAACKANLHPLGEPSDTERRKMRASLEAALEPLQKPQQLPALDQGEPK